MGERGTKKKPDWLNILDGNPGKRPIKQVPGELFVKGGMKAPDNLSDRQKEIWNQVVKILTACNALTSGNDFPLLRYVQMWAVYEEAAKVVMGDQLKGKLVFVRRDASGEIKDMKMLPQLRTMLEISNHLLRIEQHFGLTPSTRGDILNGKSEGTGDDGDDF